MIRTKELNQASLDFLYLLACALSGCRPNRQRVEHMELERIYALGRFHTLPAILYMVLEETGAFSNDSEWMQQAETKKLVLKWKDKKEKAIRKVLLLDAERKSICDYMERSKIWYLPLKGIVLKDYYPKLGMRQMADNDILYDAVGQMQLKKYMVSRGYMAVSVGKSNHDVYEKPPIYNFELHTALYGSAHDSDWVAYYSDVKKRLMHDEGCEYGYHFSDEDFYVYIISHAYKHFNGSGTGIRSLMDIYVYLKKKEETLQWPYIKGELAKFQIGDFEEASRKLSQKLFSMKEYALSIEELQMLNYYLGSGTYGTIKNRIEKKLHEFQPDGEAIKSGTKLRYIKDRLFPDTAWYQKNVPTVYAHRWLVVFYVPFRMFRGIVKNGQNIMREVRTVRKTRK